MDQKTFNISIAAYLAILIPLPGRFIFGFTLFFEFLLLTIIGTSINSLINKMKLQEIRSFLIMLTLISSSILYRQILVITYAEIALTLGYYVFLPSVSILLIFYLFNNYELSITDRLKINLKHMFIFSICGLLFCLFRDIAGYGTFTFFGKNHQIYEKVLTSPNNPGIFSFISSIPGALILASIILYVQLIIKNKMRIFKNAEVNNVIR